MTSELSPFLRLYDRDTTSDRPVIKPRPLCLARHQILAIGGLTTDDLTDREIGGRKAKRYDRVWFRDPSRGGHYSFALVRHSDLTGYSEEEQAEDAELIKRSNSNFST